MNYWGILLAENTSGQKYDAFFVFACETVTLLCAYLVHYNYLHSKEQHLVALSMRRSTY